MELTVVTIAKFGAAGDIIKELSLQEIDMKGPQTSGGFFTVPGTSTVGAVCTISWECGGFVCGWPY
jgi:hypothetical protein